MDKHGVPVAEGKHLHTQLGTNRKGKYPQAREFGADGEIMRDIDFTDYGRPHDYTRPHQHKYVENET